MKHLEVPIAILRTRLKTMTMSETIAVYGNETQYKKSVKQIQDAIKVLEKAEEKK